MEERFSRIISRILDRLGYNQPMITIRRKAWRQIGNGQSFQNISYGFENDTNIKCTGSKAEGLSNLLESDVDCMILIEDIECIMDRPTHLRQTDKTIVQADMQNTPPGYTKLKLLDLPWRIDDAINISLFKTPTGESYLSSSIFALEYYKIFSERSTEDFVVFGYDQVGPATNMRLKYVSCDTVPAIPCYAREILNKWVSRRRLHTWPSADVVQEASSLVAQIVPVGSKRSCEHWQEWRFCFVDSDMKLTESLNDVQTKLYILLKRVAKDVMKTECDAMSSYVMKNVTYWLAELLPASVFTENNLVRLVIVALQFLKSAIATWNWLPYYMIPGRNLLAERLNPGTRRQLSDLLSELIEEGPMLLL